ncbi:MAG: isoprenoid biosynthesis glyoxalase ElbB [Desulfuromonas sp.]|nr:isoprenoid biosynthesis glyoxalase ElbB [Desulfuromonas sp.]
MTKIGVVLSGCGVFDGSEIHESVIALLAIDRCGAEAVCMAPDVEQSEVVDHLTGEKAYEDREVLLESARIARGKIKDLKTISAADIDALVLPGGLGAAKNLSTFATTGADCGVNSDLAELVTDMVAVGKPIVAICIAPVVIAKILCNDNKKPHVTIGNDKATAEAVEQMGAKHVECAVDECVVDEQLKLVTTPAYMLANSISEVATGIDKAIAALFKLL